MTKRSSANVAAVIEIAAGAVRMRVSQLKRGRIEVLDRLEYPLYLGHEVFNEGRVRFESLRQLSAVLKKFSAALAGYGCKNVRLISSATMREAENRAFVADQLKIHNGMKLEILEYSEEKAMISSEIIRVLRQENMMDPSNALIAYIGSGSIGLSLYDGAAFSLSQNLPVGSVKLYDTLRAISRESDEFYPLLEEYLDVVLNRVEIPANEIENLVLSGSDLARIAPLCGAENVGGVYTIRTKKLRETYHELRTMTYPAIARRLNISEETAAVVYTSLAIYNAMLRYVNDPKRVVCPAVDITDAVTRHMLLPGAQKEYLALTRQSAVASAKRIAKKYNCNAAHAQATAAFALSLFDKLKAVHGLAPERRNILELVSYLHSTGQYINVRTHTECSFDLIKNLDIFGMTAHEIRMAAFVSGYDELTAPGSSDPAFFGLSEEERTEIMKMVAIFRIANALDKSKRQKLTVTKIKLTEETVEIRADTKVDALLEKWAFSQCAGFFKEVFGIAPELVLRTNLL